MPKQIIGETFEQLGKTAGQAVKQVAQEPGKVAETAAKQVGMKPEPEVEQPQGATSAQIAQKEQKRKRLLTALEAEIKDIRLQRQQELPRQITGKPGFSEEKAIKQIKLEEEGKRKLPPVVELAQKKAGTGERKRMGVSG